MQGAPWYDVDIYSDEVIAEPYRHYRAIRDAGPAVWLPRNDLWVVGRFADVRAVLLQPSVFSSAHGVAANAVLNNPVAGNIITTDPPEHAKMRAIVRAPLTIPALNEIAPSIEAEAESLVERLVSRGSFDVVSDFARHLPVSIVSDLVGLPEEGRSNMLRWASATFDALGSMNGRGSAAMPDVQELHAYCENPATIKELRPDGWAAAIWRAAERGDLHRAHCPQMMRAYVVPSLDTTIHATSSLIWLLGQNPEQWDLVRKDATLIPSAINEAVRLESPVRGFTRYATKDCSIDSTLLPAGARVLVLYASGNRDERKWHDPDRFDVRRDVGQQLGFGFGTHICVGMHLARLEMTALVTALAKRVSHIEVSKPVWAMNNVLRGLESLQVTVR
jgi:cytochrome P450